ncbi:MAG: hypothetical protein WC777_02340 [Candidatus Gracilibacteria bacterium]
MPFIQEFQNLLRTQPRYNLKLVMAENCGYSDTAVKSKNCYYCFGVFYCEDVYYGRYSRKCSDCSGVSFCVNCQWCTECVDCVNCYSCDFCQDCQNCAECQYSQDCYGCKNCFGCVGLYQKQYHLFNQPLSKEEYVQKIAQFDLSNPDHLAFIQTQVEALKRKTPLPAFHQTMTENCTGDHITESKNCFNCYDIFASEDCLYTVEANANKDCVDLTVCFEAEALYSCVQSPLCFNCNFCLHTDRSSDSEFCAYSRNLKNCFGCVYLENKEYHILNQPYSPEDYAKKVAEIHQELIAGGHYNLTPYFISDYEHNRLQTETDSPLIL